MKKTITLFGAIVCVMTASVVQASPDTSTANVVVKSKAPKTAAAVAQPRHATVYITNVEAVGSHIPLVVRRYHGQVDSMSPTVAYSPQLDQTGQTNVGAELSYRDPAFAGFGGARR